MITRDKITEVTYEEMVSAEMSARTNPRAWKRVRITANCSFDSRSALDNRSWRSGRDTAEPSASSRAKRNLLRAELRIGAAMERSVASTSSMLWQRSSCSPAASGRREGEEALLEPCGLRFDDQACPAPKEVVDRGCRDAGGGADVAEVDGLFAACLDGLDGRFEQQVT